MAGDQRHRDRLSQERTEEFPPHSLSDGDLDMGGGGPTGASGPGTPHRSNLDSRGGSPIAGALDDLPDMTGSGDSGSAGDDLGDTPGQGISPEDFRTQGSSH